MNHSPWLHYYEDPILLSCATGLTTAA